jgi:hypothetical protein
VSSPPKNSNPNGTLKGSAASPPQKIFMEVHMRKSTKYGRTDNRPHQNRLANMLIHEVGFDEAVNLCIRNGWDGTLSMLKLGSPK